MPGAIGHLGLDFSRRAPAPPCKVGASLAKCVDDLIYVQLLQPGSLTEAIIQAPAEQPIIADALGARGHTQKVKMQVLAP
eukprot:4583642-Pyramimonas_sp.AAC.1